jgi:hypothetical protein
VVGERARACDNAYEYPVYVIAVTRVVYPNGNVQDFVNLMTQQKLPGRYTVYQKINKGDIDDAMQKTEVMMTAQNFVSVVEPKAIPVRPDRLQFTSGLIESTNMTEDEITVMFKKSVKTPQQVNQLAVDLVKELKHIVFRDHPRNKDVILYRIGKGKKTQQYKVYLKFRINPSAEEGAQFVINPFQRSELRKILQLTDRQVLQLQDALENVKRD